MAVMLLAVSTALAGTRGSLGTPILLSGGREEKGFSGEVAGALTASFIFGLIAGLLVAAGGAWVGLPLEGALVGLSIPFVLVEDVGRYAALARGDQHGAVLWDGAWAVGSAVLLVATWIWPSGIRPAWILGTWAALALVSAVALMLRGRLTPSVRELAEWWRKESGGRLRYGAEGLLGTVTSLVVVSAASAIVGPRAAAALRGAGTLLGPLSVIMSAVPLAVVPETSRTTLTLEQTWAPLRRIGFLLSALSLTVSAIAVVLPHAIGRALLGDTWAVAAPILPITGLEYAGLAWVSVTYTLLRAQGRSGALLRARMLHSGVSLVCALGAAVVFANASAVAWSLVVTALIVAVLVRPLVGLSWRIAS